MCYNTDLLDLVCARLAQLVRSLTANQEVPVQSSVPWPGRGLNFGRPFFATPSVDMDVKLLPVQSLDVLSGGLKGTSAENHFGRQIKL